MIDNIPFWKIVKKNNKIVSVIMYKDKDGRKMVAGGAVKTKEGVSHYAKMTKEDLERSWVELSGKALDHLKKSMGADFLKYAIPVDIVKKNSLMI